MYRRMKARTRINSEDFPCCGSKKTEKIYFFRDFGRRLKMALETLANKKKTNLIEKHCFPQFSTRISWNRSLAAVDLFYMTTQLIKFYTPDCDILRSTDVWTRRFNKQTENEWLLLSATFMAKFELVLVLLTQKSAFS